MASKFLGLLALCLVGSVWGLKNSEVERSIDLRTNIVRESINITLTDGPATSFDIIFPDDFRGQIGWVGANQEETPLRVAKKGSGYTVTLSPPLKSSSDSVEVSIALAYANAFTSIPAVLTKQNEAHFIVYNGNTKFYSPYESEEQKTTVILPVKAAVESHSPTGAKEGDKTVYKFDEVPARGVEALMIHFQSHAPFILVEGVHRTLQISHWGSVLQVEEKYRVRNVAAKFEGSFSRLDHQRMPSPSAVQALPALLPSDAFDIYFRDVIGNISTSTVSQSDDQHNTWEFKQRFPMFGGWRTEFTFGYNLPLSKYMSVVDGKNQMTFPAGSPFVDVLAQEFTTQVIFPEGTSAIKLEVADAKPEGMEESITKTYLDSSGRPTYTWTVLNVANPDNTEQIEISYTQGGSMNEPFLLITGFLAIFAASGFLMAFL